MIPRRGHEAEIPDAGQKAVQLSLVGDVADQLAHVYAAHEGHALTLVVVALEVTAGTFGVFVVGRRSRLPKAVG